MIPWIKHRLARFLNKHPGLLLGFVLLYVISPFDVLPEALTGIVGFLDDLLVIVASIYLRRLGRQDYVDTTAEEIKPKP